MKKFRKQHSGGFTLIEVLVSLAIFTFVILVIVASLGTSGNYAANDARRTVAVDVLHNCFRDIELTNGRKSEKSPTLAITPIPWESSPAKIRLWFDINGRRVDSEQNAFYRCDLTPKRVEGVALGNLHGRIVWPAKKSKGVPDGDVELFTSFLLP